MNEPIINPWIFYAADVIGSINLVINVLVWILCIATAIAFATICRIEVRIKKPKLFKTGKHFIRFKKYLSLSQY